MEFKCELGTKLMEVFCNATSKDVAEFMYEAVVMLPVLVDEAEDKPSLKERLAVHKLLEDIWSGDKRRVLNNKAYREALYAFAYSLLETSEE